ncbi:hypothetical protein HDU80_005773 [Chytriomyces hyalinus]|nr:hypothetical protein HDU80_005773 [Chytriomyces hyalinus]
MSPQLLLLLAAVSVLAQTSTTSLGCFTFPSPPSLATIKNNMDAPTCIAACATTQYALIAPSPDDELAFWCACRNDLPQTALAASMCNEPCSIGTGGICGGINVDQKQLAWSMFATGVVVVVPSPSHHHTISIAPQPTAPAAAAAAPIADAPSVQRTQGALDPLDPLSSSISNATSVDITTPLDTVNQQKTASTTPSSFTNIMENTPLLAGIIVTAVLVLSLIAYAVTRWFQAAAKRRKRTSVSDLLTFYTSNEMSSCKRTLSRSKTEAVVVAVEIPVRSPETFYQTERQQRSTSNGRALRL